MFIGSSTESLRIAQAIQTNLQHDVDSTIWTQGVFLLGQSTLPALLNEATRADFATFLLSPDDVSRIREADFKTARDNVILELGLFAGALGARRVFFIVPRLRDFHLPTDLHGITAATYDPRSHNGNIHSAIGAATNQIAQAITALTSPGPGRTNLNGDWEGEWHFGRQTYPAVNPFHASITHIGDSIRSQFETNGEFYSMKGTIHRGNLITGIWGNPEAGAAYFGPFQLVISPDGKILEGAQSGLTRENKVDSGVFIWRRKP